MNKQTDLNQITGNGIDLHHPVTIMMATRWEWTDTKVQLLPRVRTLLQNVIDAMLDVSSQYEKLQRRGHLTPAGLVDVIKTTVVKDFAPRWRAADMDGWRKLPVEIGYLKHQMVPVVDKADFAGAVLRSDLRRLWMAMKPPQRIGLVVNPTRDLAAALLEIPGALIGLNEHDAALLQSCLGVPSRTFALMNAVCHCSSRGLRYAI